MRIGLIRHGLTDWNALGRIQGHSDIPLNDEGRRQAGLLAERLVTERESVQWDFIVASELSRAQETAQIIADRLHIPLLEPDQRLKERSFGQVEGLTWQEREEKWGADWETLELGQEKVEDIQARGLEFLNHTMEQYPEQNILVVSHGGFLSQLFTLLLKEAHTERIGNLSLTVLERTEQEWTTILYNNIQHLQ
ncbi:Phosphoglycerate mutase (2,3-diphosphoglycerate-independent) [Paenibacillus nuruki]|uniref:Phosphoglycerate mutase (2,3-diphosphoglycerate-independent) n=1 Tax=Paenibacillus nuruki TaxID=1886670 RepID=A0A1E3L351_9BACL|nr:MULTISPECIES: histidine phosphatase family protein [Paenibacillus]ODP28104.1 Phosphoglycerate mutase (2,3-diphosphoglycerate-independent) [Paenibacillus nuruki]TKJ94006.1 histidine phosphatase family protein [Paenibacillus sp. CFBP13512]